MKVKWLLDRLGREYRWVETDIMSGETRTPEFLEMNPAGQVPLVILPDGRPLAQSNAILLHLAEDRSLIPSDVYERSRMLEWLFWEQYSHEPYVAVARFQRLYLGKAADAIEPRIMARGEAALDRLEDALTGVDWLVGEEISLADIALVAYTRMATDGGFDLSERPHVTAWIERVEGALGLGHYRPE